MPTQTRFIAPSGASNLDLSGIFADLDGGTSYGTATNFKVGSLDLTGYFHASSGSEDRPNFNTGYKVNGTDLSAIFRRRGYSGVLITSQPQTQTKTTTQSVTFSVTFNSLSSVSYQWKKNGSNIAGQSGSTGTGNAQTLTYTINGIAMADAAIYTITIGGTTSQNARLNISPRIITTNVAAGSYTLYYGTYGSQSLTLQITSADGETPLSYQWYKDNVSLGSANGANTATFSKTVANGDSGAYKCIVSNSYGSATSGNFTISALSGVPVITSQPQSQVVNNNSTATFSVSASANGTAIGYQWKKGGIDIFGATSPTYTTPALTTANDTDTYFCNVYTNYGNVNSSTVSTKIKPYITSIVTNPNPLIFSSGSGPVAVQCYALGSGTIYFSWFKDGVAVPNQQNQTYSQTLVNGQEYVFVLTESTRGAYTCKVTSTYDAIGQTGGPIYAYMTPNITSHPASATRNAGQSITFSVAAQGTTPLSYQWYRDGSSISGATSSSYTFTASASDNGDSFYCIVQNTILGTTYSSTSNSAVLTVYYVTINSNPSGGTYNTGDTVSLSVNVSANPSSPTYRWQYAPDNLNWEDVFNEYFDNGNGSDTNNLTFLATGNDIGYYRCKITNAAGTFYSSSAYISVI